MTFQIGMVGTDGVLLASDKLSTQSATEGYRDTFLTDKIRITESWPARVKHFETPGMGI